MPNFLITLTLPALLLIQCGTHNNESKSLTTSPQQTASPSNSTRSSQDSAEVAQQPRASAGESNTNSSTDKPGEARCDFSAYTPKRISHFVTTAALRTPKPEYPPEAIRNGIHGRVQVKILVNSNGEVEKACATSGDATLQRAAEAAALQWKFKPNFGFDIVRSEQEDHNKKIYVMDFLPFNFVLDKKDADIGITVTP